jgi:two-component system, chemotaxis family, chemotaxis protein CheY
MPDTPQEPAPKTTKVLLIDDDQLTRTTLRAILKDDGYSAVREATEAVAGLRMAVHFRPDVICLDVQMPGKNGMDLLIDLKARLPDTPVLMVTSSNDRTTVEACLVRGANGFIIKPFSAEKLLQTIEACVTGKPR